MKQHEVFTLVNNETEKPPINETVCTSFDNGRTFKNISVRNEWNKKDVVYPEWLKKEEGYFFTENELEDFSIGLIDKMIDGFTKDKEGFSSERAYHEYLKTIK